MPQTVDGLMVVDVDGRESAFDSDAMQLTIRQTTRPELVEPAMVRLTEVLRRVKVRRLGAGTIRSLIQEITEDATEDRLERIVKADANVTEPVVDATLSSITTGPDQPDVAAPGVRVRRSLGLYARQALAKRMDRRFDRVARYLQQLEEAIVAHARANSETPDTAQRTAVDRIQNARRLLYHPRDLHKEVTEELEHVARELARTRAFADIARTIQPRENGAPPRLMAPHRLQVSIHRVDCVREGAPALGADQFFHRGQFIYEQEIAALGAYDHYFDSGETHEPRRYRISAVDLVPGRKSMWIGTHFVAERELCDPSTADAMARLVTIIADLSAKAGMEIATTAATEEVRRICEQNGVGFETMERISAELRREIEDATVNTIVDVQSELCHFVNRALGQNKFQSTPFTSRVHIDWTDPDQPPIWTAFLNQRQVGGVQVGAVEVVSHRLNLVEAVEFDETGGCGHYRIQFRFHVSAVH